MLGVACSPAAVPTPTAVPAKPAATVPAAKPTEAPAAKAPPSKAEGPAAKESPAAKAADQPAAKVETKPAAKPAFDEKAVADFYRGKTVRLISGFGPGGAFDAYTRMLGRHMGKYIPGAPNVIVENKPGAGSILGLNLVYASEPKDGTAIAAPHENLVLQQALGGQGIEFDMAKMQWLGAIDKSFNVCFVRKDVIANPQELLSGKQAIMTSGGPGTGTHDVPSVLNFALGTNFKMIPGYDTLPKMILSIQQKEADGACPSMAAMTSQFLPLLEGPGAIAHVLVVTADRPQDHPLLKGAPLAPNLAKTEEGKQLLKAIDAPVQMSRPHGVAAEAPKDRVEALRHSFSSALADQGFLAEAKQQRLDVVPSTGVEVERIIKEVLSIPKSTLDRLKELTK